MGALLGLCVSVTYGAADFFGGVSAKRVPTRVVILVGQLVGLIVVFGAVLADGPRSPDPGELLLGIAAGAMGITGLALLYRGLATAQMGVVAPLAAIGSGALPVLWAIASGDRVSAPAFVGIAIALVAVALVSRGETLDPSERGGGRGRGVVYGLGAGLGFGAFYIIFGTMRASAGFWPLAVERTAATAAVAGLVVAGARGHRRLHVPGDVLGLMLLAGLMDAGANVIYILATRAGGLATVSVLASLYPASTVILARFLLDERMGRAQLAGIGLALVGVALMAGG